MPHYRSGKIGWRQRNVFLKESSFTRLKSDVRQGATDRDSARIANPVVVEHQRLQRLVLAANRTQTHLDDQKENVYKMQEHFGWRDCNVH